MNFIITGNTDTGIKKTTNQDSLAMMTFNTVQGKMVLAVICDGMGGLEKGEVASASVVLAFREWANERLKELSEKPIEDSVLREQWGRLIDEQNRKIKAYGGARGVKLGTTVTATLITQTRYYILNVGDSRAYEIKDSIRQLTSDQTVVAKEVALGKLTPEEAERDPRRSILLQCVGASDNVYPDMFFGETLSDAVYMLCCDGFRHEITPQEMLAYFRPDRLLSEEHMHQAALNLIELNKQRQERDNITVALVRTY